MTIPSRRGAEAAQSTGDHVQGPKILVAGYYGFGNLGDDAILDVILKYLARELPRIPVGIVGEDSPYLAQRYGLPIISWHDYAAVVDSVERADLLIVGGGGLLNSYLDYRPEELLRATDLFSVFVFGLPILARILETRCTILAVGASEIAPEAARLHVRAAVDAATSCSVRDRRSKKILESLGCRRNIEVTLDPAFALQPAPDRQVTQTLRLAGIDERAPLIAVSVRNWTFGEPVGAWDDALSRALTQLSHVSHAELLFIPFQTSADTPHSLSDDRTAILRVRHKLDSSVITHAFEDVPSPAIAAGALSRCAMLVGMRMHSCILAIGQGTPLLALAYEPKVAGMMSHVGLGDLVVLPGERDTLEARLLDVYRKRAVLHRRVKHVAETSRLVALKGLRGVQSTLATPSRPLLSGEPQSVADLVLEIVRRHTRELAVRAAETDPYRRVLVSQVNKGQYENVVDLLRELGQCSPRDPEYAYLLAFCLHQLGRDLDEALHLYDRALDLGLAEFWVLYNRGLLFARLGRSAEAMIDLKRATELDPAHEGARTCLETLQKEQA
jgi:polysaccharide pyruvyl transferase CsaB